jgi:hypothetical protein
MAAHQIPTRTQRPAATAAVNSRVALGAAKARGLAGRTVRHRRGHPSLPGPRRAHASADPRQNHRSHKICDFGRRSLERRRSQRLAIPRAGGRASLTLLVAEAGDVANVPVGLRRLIDRGLLYRPTRATYDFALPLFGPYLRRRAKITKLSSGR